LTSVYCDTIAGHRLTERLLGAELIAVRREQGVN